MSERTPRFLRRVPEGDDRVRRVCGDCGFVDYENPKIVVGSVCRSRDDRILLAKRAIEPRRGFWTLPAGFLEEHETVEAGAAREAWEEARARITITSVLAVYSIPHISQVQIMFRARLENEDVSAGPESEEVGLFRFEEIPWQELAFPSVRWALEQWHATRDLERAPAFSNPSVDEGGLG